jgi:hypothetical protein
MVFSLPALSDKPGKSSRKPWGLARLPIWV